MPSSGVFNNILQHSGSQLVLLRVQVLPGTAVVSTALCVKGARDGCLEMAPQRTLIQGSGLSAQGEAISSSWQLVMTLSYGTVPTLAFWQSGAEEN